MLVHKSAQPIDLENISNKLTSVYICVILLASFVHPPYQLRTGYSPPYHTWSEALKVLSRFCSASSVPGGNGYFKHWSWANGKGILCQVWNMWQDCCVSYALTKICFKHICNWNSGSQSEKLDKQRCWIVSIQHTFSQASPETVNLCHPYWHESVYLQLKNMTVFTSNGALGCFRSSHLGMS